MSEVKRKGYLSLKFPPEFSGLLHTYYDKVFLDDSLTNLDAVLFSIYILNYWNKEAKTEYSDVKGLYVRLGRKEESFKGVVYSARKLSLIDESNGSISFSINGLKRIRKTLGQLGKTPVYLIKSGKSFTAIKLFEEFLVSEIDSEEILLCDPYVDGSTLFPLSNLNQSVKALKILTSNLFDRERFNDYKKRMEKESSINIEMKTSKKIHDRYLLSGSKCWYFGTSIKDLGNKDTTLLDISEVSSSLTALFWERWNESKAFD